MTAFIDKTRDCHRIRDKTRDCHWLLTVLTILTWLWPVSCPFWQFWQTRVINNSVFYPLQTGHNQVSLVGTALLAKLSLLDITDYFRGRHRSADFPPYGSIVRWVKTCKTLIIPCFPCYPYWGTWFGTRDKHGNTRKTRKYSICCTFDLRGVWPTVIKCFRCFDRTFMPRTVIINKLLIKHGIVRKRLHYCGFINGLLMTVRVLNDSPGS